MNAKIKKFLNLEAEKLEILKALRASDLEDLTIDELYELFVVQGVSNLYPNYDEFQEFLSYETFQLISFKALEAFFVTKESSEVEKASSLLISLDRKRSYRVGFSTIKKFCVDYFFSVGDLKTVPDFGSYLTDDFINLVNILDFIWEREGNFDFIKSKGWVAIGGHPTEYIDITYSYDGNGGLRGQCLDMANCNVVCWDYNTIYNNLKTIMTNDVFDSEYKCVRATVEDIKQYLIRKDESNIS